MGHFPEAFFPGAVVPCACRFLASSAKCGSISSARCAHDGLSQLPRAANRPFVNPGIPGDSFGLVRTDILSARFLVSVSAVFSFHPVVAAANRKPEVIGR